MELGQRLKQARLEAGLSQRQLCGDVITRNMLSQIENGSARPSMDTLQYLASQLGKSVGYFLEGASASPNHQRMAQAREAYKSSAYAQVLSVLEDYQAPDEASDPEFHLLRCLSLLALAEAEGSPDAARQLLAQAREAGVCTPYYTDELERRRLFRLAEASPDRRSAILESLDDRELLLRSACALDAGDIAGCISLLNACAHRQQTTWLLLRGDAAMAAADLTGASLWYHAAEALSPEESYPRLEQLYLQLEDYKRAYEYACKQRK